MRGLHFLLPWFAPLATAAALVWSAMAAATPVGCRRRVLREEDLPDWLLHDIGWRDGRDLAARRTARDAERRFVR